MTNFKPDCIYKTRNGRFALITGFVAPWLYGKIGNDEWTWRYDGSIYPDAPADYDLMPGEIKQFESTSFYSSKSLFQPGCTYPTRNGGSARINRILPGSGLIVGAIGNDDKETSWSADGLIIPGAQHDFDLVPVSSTLKMRVADAVKDMRAVGVVTHDPELDGFSIKPINVPDATQDRLDKHEAMLTDLFRQLREMREADKSLKTLMRNDHKVCLDTIAQVERNAEDAPNPGQPWSGVAVCRCATHNWPFPVGTMPDPVCPLGRIQLATEAAIAAIHAAVKP